MLHYQRSQAYIAVGKSLKSHQEEMTFKNIFKKFTTISFSIISKQCEFAIKTSNYVHVQARGIEEVWRRKWQTSFYVFFSFKWNFYVFKESENCVDVNTVQGIPVQKHQPFWQAHAHWRGCGLGLHVLPYI